ncbi:MAG: hypothetical protein JNK14_05715 [Chitinophagaceae bacterium]|nr:hypothetical protein [Chitinophagaceae bacterium]
MDVVIPFINTPTNKELLYSLRSLTGNRIVIVGEKPTGFKNYHHIPCGDKIGSQHKEANIFRKLLKACDSAGVSDPFIYSMDDVMYLQPPINEDYYQGTLKEKIDRTDRANPYRKTMQQTYAELYRHGYDTTHYDIHGPTIIQKSGFELLTKFDWKKPYSYGIRSMYGNVNSIGGLSISDCKIDTPHLLDELHERTKGRMFFSIGDKMNRTLEYFLQNIWPDGSEFEI